MPTRQPINQKPQIAYANKRLSGHWALRRHDQVHDCEGSAPIQSDLSDLLELLRPLHLLRQQASRAGIATNEQPALGEGASNNNRTKRKPGLDGQLDGRAAATKFVAQLREPLVRPVQNDPRSL